MLLLAACSGRVGDTLGRDTAPPDTGVEVTGPCRDGLVLRPAENLWDAERVATLVDLAVSRGVEVIDVAVKQDDDDAWKEGDSSGGIDSGYAFFPSAVAPVAAGFQDFDAVGETVRAAHAAGLEVRAWIPQFHDRAAILTDPDRAMLALVQGEVVPWTNADGKSVFLDPGDAEVRAYQLAFVEEVVSTYDFDGVVLDWVRYDDWPMDLGQDSRDAYAAVAGVDPLSLDFEVDSPERQAWGAWRADIVASHIAEVADTIHALRPGIPVGVYILPPEFEEVSQDLARFADSIDFVAPMAYADDWGFPTAWVGDTLLAQVTARAGDLPITPVLDHDWDATTRAEVLAALAEHGAAGALWFAYRDWDAQAVDAVTTQATDLPGGGTGSYCDLLAASD